MAEERTEERKHGIIGGLVDTFYHTLDPKSRLTIPSEWRDAMGGAAYVYVFPDAVEDCLDLIPMREMEKVLADLQKSDLFDEDADAMAQALAQHAQMLKIDAAGRIRIGDALLNFAGITGRVTMVGAFRKAKLWAGEKKPAQPSLDLSSFRAAIAKRKTARQGGGL